SIVCEDARMVPKAARQIENAKIAQLASRLVIGENEGKLTMRVDTCLQAYVIEYPVVRGCG
ncbi:MAG: hypothetical protein MN733_32620, partial [Nitrososphaera sp.]|nr:hypothetical protein [Nitrososphaera sp.]